MKDQSEYETVQNSLCEMMVRSLKGMTEDELCCHLAKYPSHISFCSQEMRTELVMETIKLVNEL